MVMTQMPDTSGQYKWFDMNDFGVFHISGCSWLKIQNNVGSAVINVEHCLYVTYNAGKMPSIVIIILV